MLDISRNSFSHFGPAFLVYLGCLDPGRWATAAEAGSRFGLELVWVLISACTFSAILQSLSSRLRLATGRNLAQICCEKYPKSLTSILWFQCEVSALLGDLSMVLGIAMTLNALLGLSMTFSVVIAAVDALIFLLVLPHLDLYKAGIFIASIMSAVILSFTAETLYSNVSSTPALFQGLIPRFRGEIMYVAAGIIGSNVIPSNIYLQSEMFACENCIDSQKSTILHQNVIGISLASGVLFLVNLAVLSSATAIFHNSGYLIIVLQDAQALMEQVLSSSVAPAAFGFALICVGHLSTLSGTVAGHIAAQSFLGFDLPLFLHRILIRMGAIIVALFLIWSFGSEGVYQILIFSQVVLALQLPFFIVPLLKITSSEAIMGNFKNSLLIETVSWICTGFIFILDVLLIFDALFGQNDEYMASETMNFMRDILDSSTKWGEAVSFFCLITAVGITTWSTFLLMTMISMPIKAELHMKQADLSLSGHTECIPENAGLDVNPIQDNKIVQDCSNLVLHELGKSGYTTLEEAEQPHNDLVRDPDRTIMKEIWSGQPLQNEFSKDICIESTAIVEEKQLDAQLHGEFCRDSSIMHTTKIVKEVSLDEQQIDKPYGDTSCLLVGIQSEMQLRNEFGIDADITSTSNIIEIQSDKQVCNELVSTTETVEEVQLEDSLSHYAEHWPTDEVPYAEVKVEVTPSTAIDAACLPYEEKETRSDSSPIHMTSETFDLSSNHSLEPDVKDLQDADVSGEVVHPKRFDYEVDNELLDKYDDDDIDGWEALDQDDAFQDTPNIGDSVNSLTLEEPGSGKSFSARSDVSEGSCGSSGSFSRLGRSARKQFAALLEEFWSKLYDLHGQAVGKPGLPSLKVSQANAFRHHTSVGYNDSNSNQYASRAAQKAWNKNTKEDIYDSLPKDTVGSLYVHAQQSHDRIERRYSSLKFPSSRGSFDSQPVTIHGYKMANYAGRGGKFSIGSDISPFVVEQQKPFLQEKPSHVSSISKLPVSTSCAFEKIISPNSQQLKSPLQYSNKRFFDNSSDRMDRIPYTGGNASIWDPLVYRVTGELGLSHHEHNMPQLGEVSCPLMQQPVGRRGYFGTNASDHFMSQSERAPLSFDEISPSQSRKDAFSIQSSSLWSMQPFEQLFGSSHSTDFTYTNTENASLDRHLSSPVKTAQNIAGNNHDLEILNALRLCIRKLLKLDGSDWIFRIESGSDEDLIGRISMREKILLEADAKELYKSQTRTEQLLVINYQKPLVVAKNNPDLMLSALGVPHCGEGCVWNMELVVSFGVWCMHRILELALMESRPELWGKYTYVLNRLQGILDQAFSKPRTVLTSCICVISEASDVQIRDPNQIGSTKDTSNHLESWPGGCNMNLSKGQGANASTFLDIIKVVEVAIGSRKGRSGTAAGDVAFPKGKENLASVLKRYKRRLSNRNSGTTMNASGVASNHRTLG